MAVFDGKAPLTMTAVAWGPGGQAKLHWAPSLPWYWGGFYGKRRAREEEVKGRMNVHIGGCCHPGQSGGAFGGMKD